MMSSVVSERIIREIEKLEEHVWLNADRQHRGYHCVFQDAGEALEGLELLKYKEHHQPDNSDPPRWYFPGSNRDAARAAIERLNLQQLVGH